MTRQTDDAVQPSVDGGDRTTGPLTVAREFATVTVERRDLGGVRVRTVTERETVLHPVETRTETVEVTRHPVDREVERIPEPRTEGDLTIIPVVEERAVVVTRLFVTEEIHIRRRQTTRRDEVPVTLRRQRAVIERLEDSPGPGPEPAPPSNP